jgi:hypothetical protein
MTLGPGALRTPERATAESPSGARDKRSAGPDRLLVHHGSIPA